MSSEIVPEWPRVTAVVHADATGTVATNGISRSCAAESVDALRVGMIAYFVELASTLRRPIRLDVTEGDRSWRMAVRPSGIVQEIDADGAIAPADDLVVAQGNCRGCGQLQPVTVMYCRMCGVEGPLRVALERPTPSPVAHDHVQGVAGRPDTLPTLQELTTINAGREPAEPPTNPEHDETTTIRLRLRFSTQPEILAPPRVVIGRNPVPVDGRAAIQVMSPGLEMSRTHALVDVDDDGRILVTDHDSGNGILIEESATTLRPGFPTVVENGATLRLGDVTLTVALAA